MSYDVQTTDNKPEVKRHPNSPKYSKTTWETLKLRFLQNSYTSLSELASEFGIQYSTLTSRMVRERWNEQQRALQSKVEARVEQRVVKEVDRVSDYLSNTFLRAKKYEKLIDASISQQATDAEGVAQVSPSDLDAYSRTELRIHDLAKSALRIPAVSAVDLTSKGLSIGESIVGAIARLREAGNAPEITKEQAARIMELEIVP